MNQALRLYTVRPFYVLDLDKTIRFLVNNNHSLCAARDCAVTHNGIALICRPGDNQEPPRGKTKDKDRREREKGGGQNIARVQDCLSVRAVLKKELGLTVVDLESPEARLSGSDVLFTGR